MHLYLLSRFLSHQICQIIFDQELYKFLCSYFICRYKWIITLFLQCSISKNPIQISATVVRFLQIQHNFCASWSWQYLCPDKPHHSSRLYKFNRHCSGWKWSLIVGSCTGLETRTEFGQKSLQGPDSWLSSEQFGNSQGTCLSFASFLLFFLHFVHVFLLPLVSWWCRSRW